MSADIKSMLEKTFWTFVGIEASTVQLAAMAGAGAALVVVKEFAKKQITPTNTVSK